MTEITSKEVATIAARVLSYPFARSNVMPASTFNNLLEEAKSIAGSALTQREDAPSREFIVGQKVMRLHTDFINGEISDLQCYEGIALIIDETAP